MPITLASRPASAYAPADRLASRSHQLEKIKNVQPIQKERQAKTNFHRIVG